MVHLCWSQYGHFSVAGLVLAYAVLHGAKVRQLWFYEKSCFAIDGSRVNTQYKATTRMHIIPSSAYYLNLNSELWLLSLQNFVHSSSVTDNTTVVHSFVEINLLIFNLALHTKAS